MPEELENNMKVRVKKKQKGFIYGKLWKRDEENKGRDVITLKPFEHPTKTNDDGDPLVVSVEDQFSKVWMEKVGSSKKEVVSDESEETKDNSESEVTTKKKTTKKKTTKKKTA